MEKLVTFCFAVLLTFTFVDCSLAQDRSKATQAAVQKIAREIVERAAYYDIVSVALLHSKDVNTAQQYLTFRKLAVRRANSLSPGIVNAQYNEMIQNMTKTVAAANIPRQIDEKLANILITDISVLRKQYGKLCKEVLGQPGERAKYWMKKVEAKPPTP